MNETEVARFERDDEGYLAWLREYLSGFVVNCAPNPSPDYLVLHRASCFHITEQFGEGEHWTHQYIKVCAPRNGILIRWGEEVVGTRPTLCPTCEPLSPGRS